MKDKDYRINWLGLFIKVIIFVVAVLLLIWLITRFTSKKQGQSFVENNNQFKNASIEYFKKDLPDVGETKTVTLKTLIDKKYIENLKNKNGKSCSGSSKSTITLLDEYYSMKSNFICGSNKKTDYTKIGNETCEECDIKINGLNIPKKNNTEVIEENNNNELNDTTVDNTMNIDNNINTNDEIVASNDNNISSSENVSQSTILYEYIKTVDEYSEWYTGTVTGNDIENITKDVSYSKYCKNNEITYYTISFASVNKKLGYSYTLELINLDSNFTDVKLLLSSNFTSIDDYSNYISMRNKTVSMVGEAKTTINEKANPYDYSNHALTNKNFVFKTSDIYMKNNKYYIDINIVIKNYNNVSPIYKKELDTKGYYVPIKFSLSYTNLNDCVEDLTENNDKYTDYKIIDTYNKQIDMYRYKFTIVEYKYSNLPEIEGYIKTGNTKQVNK